MSNHLRDFMGKQPRTIYLIKRLETVIRAQLETALLDLSLTPGQYTTLSFIATGPISSAELARRAGITPQTMSEMMATLESKNAIIRTAREENRRIADIALTDSGAALLREAEARVDRLESGLLGNLSAEENAALRQALRAILT